MAALFQGETKAHGVPAASFAAHRRNATRRDPDGWFARVAAGKFFACDAKEADLFPEVAVYHRSREHRRLWYVPIRSGGEIVGWISLAFTDERTRDANALQIPPCSPAT